MGAGAVTGIVVLAVVVALVVVLIAIYNGLVSARNGTEESWAQIDTQLQRRHDLIPNLVRTVQGYASHERETLEGVTRARTAAVDASSPGQQAEAENVLTGALRQLFALSESYPDLKADRNFAQLQEELVSTEDRVGYARQFYNDRVQRYDTKRETFPGVLVAGPLGFEAVEYFEIADEQVRTVPTVEF